jgi:hypothetical protein
VTKSLLARLIKAPISIAGRAASVIAGKTIAIVVRNPRIKTVAILLYKRFPAFGDRFLRRFSAIPSASRRNAPESLPVTQLHLAPRMGKATPDQIALFETMLRHASQRRQGKKKHHSECD